MKHFWGLTASLLGTYEAASFLLPLPTVSTWCSRKRYRRAVMLIWTVGLGLHLYRHSPDTLPPSC